MFFNYYSRPYYRPRYYRRRYYRRKKVTYPSGFWKWLANGRRFTPYRPWNKTPVPVKVEPVEPVIKEEGDVRFLKRPRTEVEEIQI